MKLGLFLNYAGKRLELPVETVRLAEGLSNGSSSPEGILLI